MFYHTFLKEQSKNAKTGLSFCRLQPRHRSLPFSPLCSLPHQHPATPKNPATSFPLRFLKHRNTSPFALLQLKKWLWAWLAAPKVTAASRPRRQSLDCRLPAPENDITDGSLRAEHSVFATHTLEDNALRVSQTSESHVVVFLLRRSLFRPTLLLFFLFSTL